MHKVFKQFKNWDLTTMGYYSYLDFQNLDYIGKQFNDLTTQSDYAKSKGIPASNIFKSTFVLMF